MNPELTPELLARLAGVLLSLLFSYIPGLNTKFAGLDDVYKKLIMLLLIFVAAVGIFVLSCTGLKVFVTCDVSGAWGLVELFAIVAIANQVTYKLSPTTPAVREAKEG